MLCPTPTLLRLASCARQRKWRGQVHLIVWAATLASVALMAIFVLPLDTSCSRSPPHANSTDSNDAAQTTPILFAGLSTMGMFACFGPLAGAFAHIMMCHQLVLLFVIFVAVCLYHSVVFTPAVLLLYEKCFPAHVAVASTSAAMSAHVSAA